MLDDCNEINDEMQAVFSTAIAEAIRYNSPRVGTEHLLLGIASRLNSIPARALFSMKIELPVLQKEIEKHELAKDFFKCEPPENELPGNVFLSQCLTKTEKELPFSDLVIQTLEKANDFALYLGQNQIDTTHLLLALLDNKSTCAGKIFEELSVNISFLKGRVMHLFAESCLPLSKTISLRSVMISGLKRLVEKHELALYMVQNLMQKSRAIATNIPKKEDVLRAVCKAYLADCLYNQIAFQRYLLEEAITALCQTAGPLDQEICTQIISATAQHLRRQARQAIEYIWTNEYRLIKHILDDAEHDLLGSVIEDLWWTYSEDIALDSSFSSALADHRRTHLLDLQSKRVELSLRLGKIKTRLEETIRHCFSTKLSS